MAAGRYVVEGLDWDQGATAGVLEVGATAPEQLTIDAVDLRWRESESRVQNCCGQTPDCYVDECFGDSGDCDICWSEGYRYSPALEFRVSADLPGYAVMARFEGGTDPTYAYPEGDLPLRIRLVGPRTSEGPLCVELTVIDATGEPIDEPVQSCHELSEFPEFERREIDNTSIMARCQQPPDNPDDPQWVAFNSEGSDDPVENNDSDSTGSEGGCSTTPASQSWVLLLLMALVARGRRAWPRASSRSKYPTGAGR